jgi:hypothetical protein
MQIFLKAAGVQSSILICRKDSESTSAINSLRKRYYSYKYVSKRRRGWQFFDKFLLEIPAAFRNWLKWGLVSSRNPFMTALALSRKSAKIRKCCHRYCSTGGPADFILIIKGTPSQEEHKTIFGGLKINKMICLIKLIFQHFTVSGRWLPRVKSIP